MWLFTNITYAQSHAQVEAFGVEIFNVSAPLTAVMGLQTALMEVMRLDAVSWLISETVYTIIF